MCGGVIWIIMGTSPVVLIQSVSNICTYIYIYIYIYFSACLYVNICCLNIFHYISMSIYFQYIYIYIYDRRL